METIEPVLPVVLFVVCVAGLAVVLLVMGNVFNPRRASRVKRMPYESGMDPIHDTRRRFDVRFHLLAIAFLVFDVELLFLYPWAVTVLPAKVANSSAVMDAISPPTQAAAATEAAAATLLESPAGSELIGNTQSGLIFAGIMVFIALLALGFIYDWRKGIFEWR